MKMQLDLIVLTKIKETIRYCESFRYGGQNALNIVAIDLTHVSVSTENGSQQSSIFIHALKGSALTCPLMPLADQHFHAHSKSYKLLTNNQNFINNKEGTHSPNSSTKSINNKITPPTTK
jgi:hypothetical protein